MDRTPDKSLVWTFPTPDTPLLAVAYRDLYLAAEGTAQQKEMLGDPALLPRRGTRPPARTRSYARKCGTGWRSSWSGSTASTCGTPTPA